MSNLNRILEKEVEVNLVVNTGYSESFDLDRAESISAQCVLEEHIIAEEAFAADTDVNTTTDEITVTGHGFVMGLKGTLTSTGTLPAGLAAATDYFVIVVDANTIKLADSYENAEAGTAIDITDVGTAGATHTFAPASVSDGSILFQVSNDGTNWADDTGTSVEITASAVTTATALFISKDRPTSRYARIKYSLGGGYISSVNQVLVRGS